MPFIALMLTTAALFLRLGEVSILLHNMWLYEITIVLTIVCGFQTLLPQFTAQGFRSGPLMTTFLVFLAALGLSSVANGYIDQGIDLMTEMLKMGLFVFLLVGIVDSKERLIPYLKATTLCAGGAMLIAFLNLWGYIHLLEQENVVEDGLVRMGGTGLFKDPNECASFAATFIPLCLYFAFRRGVVLPIRVLWIGLAFFLFQAIQATYSRGGLLAMVVGIGVVVIARFGRKSLLLAPLVLVIPFVVGGRQGDLSVTSGTGQQRIQIQHDGIVTFTRHPLFGIGPGHYADIGGFVAHNSLLQPYTEMGFLGGATTVSAYAMAFFMMIRLGSKRVVILDPDLAELRPFLLGVLACQLTAKMSLSQNYQLPTYFFWGVITVFTKLCKTEPSLEPLIKYPLFVWYLVVGVGGVMFFFVYLNTMVRYG